MEVTTMLSQIRRRTVGRLNSAYRSRAHLIGIPYAFVAWMLLASVSHGLLGAPLSLIGNVLALLAVVANNTFFPLAKAVHDELMRFGFRGYFFALPIRSLLLIKIIGNGLIWILTPVLATAGVIYLIRAQAHATARSTR